MLLLVPLLSTALCPPCFPARPVHGGELSTARFLGLLKGAHFAEPKFNGWRAWLHLPTGRLWNRHGAELSIAADFRAAYDSIRFTDTEAEWLDVEGLQRRHGRLRGSLIVLDALLPGPYTERRAVLAAAFEPFDPALDPEDREIVRLTPSYAGADDEKIFAWLQTENARLCCTGAQSFYEGLVLKTSAGLYPRQNGSAKREFPGWKKFRFV